MNELKNLEKEENQFKKITLYGYLYLFITIILKKLFNIINLEIKRKIKNFDDIYQYNFSNNKKIYIFDVGGNKGQSIVRFKRIFPNSVIYSFEPIKKIFDIIKKIFISKNIIINNCACGDKNTYRKFNVNKLSYTSSFFELNKINKRSNLLKKKKNEKVKIVKLDDYIKKIKLNT